jgi:hypothetical protein
MRREHAVVGEKRMPGWGHQRCEPGEQLDRRHDPVGAATPSRLDAVRNAVTRQEAEPIEGEAGPRAVAHEELAALVVVGLDPHRGLNVEPIELRGERAALLRLEAGVAVVCRGGAPPIERGKRAAAERNVGAGVEGAALHPLVAAILYGTLVEQRVLAEPPEGAVTDAADDAIEHGMRRWWETVELDPAGVVGREDAVGEHGMEMKIQVEAAPEPLNMVERCVLGARDAGRALLLGGDGVDEDPSEGTRDVGPERGQAAKLEQERAPTGARAPPAGRGRRCRRRRWPCAARRSSGRCRGPGR